MSKIGNKEDFWISALKLSFAKARNLCKEANDGCVKTYFNCADTDCTLDGCFQIIYVEEK